MSDSRPEFDEHAADYSDQLNQGLAWSGEGQEYYCAGRVRFLAARLRAMGFAARRVLDFGCGTGAALPVLLAELTADQVVGLDPSPASLELARAAFPGPRVGCVLPGDFTPRADFDLVFTNGVFHHIPPAQRPAALALIRASLRPGGLLAFWENNPINPGTRLLMRSLPFDRDARPIMPWAARTLITSAGLVRLATDYQFFFPAFMAALRPLEARLSKLPLGAQYMVLAAKPS